jgi:3',5'-cyclic AMP phosphodiesterase CpdA
MALAYKTSAVGGKELGALPLPGNHDRRGVPGGFHEARYKQFECTFVDEDTRWESGQIFREFSVYGDSALFSLALYLHTYRSHENLANYVFF